MTLEAGVLEALQRIDRISRRLASRPVGRPLSPDEELDIIELRVSLLRVSNAEDEDLEELQRELDKIRRERG